jgi:hypothetical protein
MSSNLDAPYCKYLSSYFAMNKNPASHGLTTQLKNSHPWITEFAFIGNTALHENFQKDLTSQVHQLTPRTTPVKRFPNPHPDCRFIKDVIDHFTIRSASDYLEATWSDSVVSSFGAGGVLRAMVFRSNDYEELKVMTQALIEFKTMKALREWEVMGSGTPKTMAAYTTDKGRKLFWCILHYYKVICDSFDESTNVKEWGRDWFNSIFPLVKSSTTLNASRELICKHIIECSATMTIRGGIVESHDQLMANLRAAVIRVSNPDELCVIRDMIRELQRCEELKRLLQGIPLPPFDMSIPRNVLKRLEHEKRVLDYIREDEVTIATVEPVPRDESGPEVGVRPDIDAMMRSATSQLIGRRVYQIPVLHDWNDAALSAQEILQQAKAIKTEIRAIRQLAAEVATDIRNLAVKEIRKMVGEVDQIQEDVVQVAAELQTQMEAEAVGLMAEVKYMQEEIIQIAVELQTIRYDQQRRAVRRAIKRIRETRSRVIAIMLPFSVEQHKIRAVQEQKLRAKNVERGIQALTRETKRINELIIRYTEEETALLKNHICQERKRTFLKAAPRFLPLAMYERDIDCGLCLETIQWKTDADIIFVTCCPEFGYMCGRCTNQPHDHIIVAEREIVRIVRSVRKELGVDT